MTEKFIHFLKRKREGILLGMLTGLLFTGYLAATGADLTFAMEHQSAIDLPLQSVMQSVTGSMQSIGVIDKTQEVLITLKDLALTKAGLTFMLIGAFIGGILDKK